MSGILLVGGTRFLGRAIAAEALRRGHRVTTLNRGRSGPDVEGVQALHADRNDLASLSAALAGRRWHAVVDTCGFIPRSVAAGARLLSEHADHYTYISAVDACTGWPEGPIDETSTRWPCPPDADESAGPYAVLKAGCERAVERYFTGASLIVRPGIIVGPQESVGRLPWWLRRLARAGLVLAPGSSDRAIQLVDCRDLATFVVDGVDGGATGRYLVTGPAATETFGSMLDLCAAAADARPELVWASDDVLLGLDVTPWWELPLWAPPAGGWPDPWSVSTRPAITAGLRCRPLTETVADTWRWLRDRPDFTGVPKVGMEPVKESRILEGRDRWASTSSTST